MTMRSVGEALTACQLGQFAERLDERATGRCRCRRGEQQRLSFARALLVKPDWLFLDEASSALDEATERRACTGCSTERLPGVTIVSIAHKPSVVRFTTGGWCSIPSSGASRSRRGPAPAAARQGQALFENGVGRNRWRPRG